MRRGKGVQLKGAFYRPLGLYPWPDLLLPR